MAADNVKNHTWIQHILLVNVLGNEKNRRTLLINHPRNKPSIQTTKRFSERRKSKIYVGVFETSSMVRQLHKNRKTFKSTPSRMFLHFPSVIFGGGKKLNLNTIVRFVVHKNKFIIIIFCELDLRDTRK